LRGLNGSASLQGKALTLTVTNADLKNAREAEISVRGAAIKAVRGSNLVADDPHAHNTFADPRRVEPKEITVTQVRNPLVYSFPPASVTRLDIELE
jgi:alpha-N-arabinofuranosidase